MILIATPISELFNDDQQALRINSLSDALECRELTKNLYFQNELLFHFDENIVCLWDSKTKSYLQDSILSKKELQLISFHVSSCCLDPILKDGFFYKNIHVYSEFEMESNVQKNIDWLRTWLNPRIKVAIENNNYYPTEAYDVITEASFLRKLVYQNQIFFLFDIAHAHITSRNRNIDYVKYKEELPLEKAIQIHISGYDYRWELCIDAHELPSIELIDEAVSLAKKYFVEFLTVEYYKNVKELLSMLALLRNRLSL
ncbi:MAG: DUF692 family protein [Oligoflexia bacterium]|nr:DUF692 family protein [Oligoflexia bacterium]